MSRETSPFVVGDFWLDKRKDGKSPDIWQITRYNQRTRSLSYTSTRCSEIEDAKTAIQAHNAAAIAKAPQTADNALLVPLLMLYWDEHGQNAIGKAQIASSLRQFIAFLMQDAESGVGITVAQINPRLFERFRKWRMAAHSYSLAWKGRTFTHSSKGVNGESVQRNLDDVRAALGHQAENGRIPYAPKVPAVKAELRSPARDRVLTNAELGAIIAFTRSDKVTHRWILLMLATAVRPVAAAKFDPAKQWRRRERLVDLHPVGDPRTKKHNPVVPVISQFVPTLRAWLRDGASPAVSRKKAWNTMRAALGLGPEVIPKTIRHTVATRLRSKGALPAEISSLLGHAVMKGSSAVYAKYDPNYLGTVRAKLPEIWNESMAAAAAWDAGHLRAKVKNEPTKVVARDAQEE